MTEGPTPGGSRNTDRCARGERNSAAALNAMEDSARIAPGRPHRKLTTEGLAMRLNYANVVATLALFLALGGTSYAVVSESMMMGSRSAARMARTGSAVPTGMTWQSE